MMGQHVGSSRSIAGDEEVGEQLMRCAEGPIVKASRHSHMPAHLIIYNCVLSFGMPPMKPCSSLHPGCSQACRTA